MEDLNSRLEKLLADAAECDLIANLATDPTKRQSFMRMADEYRAMAEEVRADIANISRS